jgi:gliding motility-associated-like protein
MLQGVNGITVITNQGTDQFGGFQTIPTINGYVYHYSILLGSTSVSYRGNTSGDPNAPPSGQQGSQPTGSQGGYVRGISYMIHVPPGPSSVPYTMTYAYAMVLENGTHASLDQPMARAIISTPAGVISCASPEYYLPTNGGALDSVTSRANGFSPSPVPTPNVSPNPTGPETHLKDVWTKGWTEVTFDLSPYRGQQVSLTFEADNCVPGGHFAYAYFALRDDCAGLQISGDTLVCANSVGKFSIPSLDSGSYEWSTPPGWALDSGGNGNIVNVKVGPQPGWIVAKERNSCAFLTDSLFVALYPGALPEAAIDPRDTTVCYGQTVPLKAIVTTGTEYAWTSGSTFTGANNGAITTLPYSAVVDADPDQTARYVLNIRNKGCPIPITDTFTVNIVPTLQVNLGNDTLVVVGEPLHFKATTNDPYPDDYQWSPATDLSDPNVADPIGLYDETDLTTITYEVKAVDTFGCNGSGSVKVTIAHSLPDIFVPNAFTPGLASNRIFRPVCYGISTLDYFRVFNRWGQLLFSTSQMGQGWDGRIQGKLQEANAYMWVVKGTDYTGKVISRQGTVVLIR